MSQIQPGTYIAKLEKYALLETRKGEPQVALGFVFKEGGYERRLNYYGLLTAKALKYTLKALIVCGLDTSRDLDELAGGNESGMLHLGIEASIVVMHEEYEINGTKKTAVKISWVNRPGGAEFRNLMNKDKARSSLQYLNVKAELEAVMKEVGAPAAPAQPKAPANPNDAPFGDDQFSWGIE